jgi:hypothetical protein
MENPVQSCCPAGWLWFGQPPQAWSELVTRWGAGGAIVVGVSV